MVGHLFSKKRRLKIERIVTVPMPGTNLLFQSADLAEVFASLVIMELDAIVSAFSRMLIT